MANLFLTWRGAVLKSGLPPTTRLVLLTLGCHMNDAGESCFPSIEMLCDETGLSKRAVLIHIKVASDAGWILVDKHGYGGRKWARNEYQIAWPDHVGDQPQGGACGAPPCGDKVVHDVPQGGARSDIGVVHDVHLNSSSNSTKNSPVASKSRPQQKAIFDANPKPQGIVWDSTGKMFRGIGDDQMQTWQEAFPKLDIDGELTRIELWYEDNPKKRKRNIKRFITGWLARAFKDSRTPKVFVKHPLQGAHHDRTGAVDVRRSAGGSDADGSTKLQGLPVRATCNNF